MGYGVRFARPDELDALPAIEIAADIRFQATAHADLVASYPTTEIADFAEAQDRWSLWVAAGEGDRPVGFALNRTVGTSDLYVAQLSVHPAHAGNRLAARLLDRLAGYCGPRGLRRLTLTTFRDIPWNAPYYAQLGFRELTDLTGEPFLGRQISEQIQAGFSPASRVAMVREIAGRRAAR